MYICEKAKIILKTHIAKKYIFLKKQKYIKKTNIFEINKNILEKH